jgi:hypothetical protein
MALPFRGHRHSEKSKSVAGGLRSSANPSRFIPDEADRPFRIVTDDSGHGRKSVIFTRNERSHSTGIPGHVQPESMVTRARNTQLALNLSDLDLEQSFLRVRQSKFYKSRLVPFGDDLTRVLRQYSRHRDRRYPHDPDAPVFSLRNGRRAHHKVIERTFRRLCLMAAVPREGGSRRQPRLRDLRHTAAVHRPIHWYRSGADLQRLLPRLATYLWHKDVSSTQHYLTLTPPLLREASHRFQRYVGDRSHD